MPKTVTMRFTRPPGFEHLTDEAWRQKLDAAVETEEGRAARARRAGSITVLGCKAIRRQSAFDQPNSSAPRKKLRPRLACKNAKRRVRILAGRRQWLADYRSALEVYRDGTKNIPFPFGTFLLRAATHVLVQGGPGPLVPPYAAALRET